jgi:lipoyl(octanoyl) transferase
LIVRNLGRLGYPEAHRLQQEVLAARIRGDGPDTLLIMEHEPVYTLGRRRTSAANVLDPGDVPIVEVERGGDVTFHGPGQLVCYPILALEGRRRDLHDHLRRLEEAAIRTCGDFGLVAQRDPRNTGAWVNGRKLCSIGIACRRWVTWHGLALNVNVDLGYFRRVNPCGLESALLTSMAAETGKDLPWEPVLGALVGHLLDVLR